MAKQVSLFTYTGTLGNTVGYFYRGKYCIRRRPVGGKRTPTMAQLVHQAKFRIVTKFVTSLNDVLRTAYTHFHGNMTAGNHLTKHIFRQALIGNYPDFRIAYDKIPVTRGNMQPTFGQVTSLLEQVEFRWDTDTGFGQSSTDRAILVVYAEAFNICIYTTAGPPRSAGVATIGVPGLIGKTVHTWLGFVSEDGKAVSNSWYTGELVVK